MCQRRRSALRGAAALLLPVAVVVGCGDGGVAPGAARGALLVTRAESEGRPADIYVMAEDGGDLRNLTATPDLDEFGPRWSPDGRRVAFLRGPSFDVDATEVYTMSADGSGVRRLTTGGGYTSVAWAPDGDRLAVVRRGSAGSSVVVLRVSEPGGGVPVAQAVVAELAGWSPDGGRIAFKSTRTGGPGPIALETVNADGTGRTTVRDAGVLWAEWAPDGRHFAVVVASQASSPDYELAVLDADGAALRRLPGTTDAVGTLAWAPDGQRIVYVARVSFTAGDTRLGVVPAGGDAPPRYLPGRGYADPSWRTAP